MTTPTEFETNKALKNALKENKELLQENNKLLKRLDKAARWGLVLRVLWFAVLIGLPFALYFYVLEPYFTAMGSSYATFEAGIREIPGFKYFQQFLEEQSQLNN